MANKKQKQMDGKIVKHYLDLLYMTSSEINAKDIADLLKDRKEFSVELWEEMNVLELELSNQNTIDFEPVEVAFTNPSDAAFVKNRNIRTIFAVHLAEEDLETVKDIFEIIIRRFSGFLGTDSADFNPIHAGFAAKP